METPQRLPRSPLLMSRDDTALLVVDVQEKLLPHVGNPDRLVWNIERLLRAAEILGLPRLATEQYPRGLGPTVPALASRLGQIPDKLSFSCGGCPQPMLELQDSGISKILVTGIESHVCVLQSVLDLLSAGFFVYVAADAVASRAAHDYEFALKRMEASGATLTTTEAALFEWCDVAGTDEFKQISRLVRSQ